MKCQISSSLGRVLTGICIFSLMLSGCGKQEAATAVKAPAAPAKEKTAVSQEQSMPREEAKEAPRPSGAPIKEERTFYDFEADLDGWEIPMWAESKTDHVARSIVVSRDVASHGTSSMKVNADFPGGLWSAGLVEIQQYLDLSNYRVIRADIFLPKDAPIGLTAKMILTIGSNWKFVEMSRSYPLIPGEWLTIEANIEPGSYDWKRVVPDEEFAEDVRKVAIRVESNRKPKYTGDFYIDNIRVGR
ncbi:MAG: hypothetical protein ABH883_02490 [Candidatus Omnitrophota bacterium]